MKDFKDVRLDRVLRSNSDGCPVFRECYENETLMSFVNDGGNYAFNEWWVEEGSKIFNTWVLSNKEYEDEGTI